MNRLLAEGIVIVMSILLAFAIDAGWERRGEVARRSALTAALASALNGVLIEVARVRPIHSEALGAAEALRGRTLYGGRQLGLNMVRIGRARVRSSSQ